MPWKHRIPGRAVFRARWSGAEFRMRIVLVAQEDAMDHQRFDELTRALASGRNRRSVLRGMLGLGGALAGAAAVTSADAARRGFSGPKLPTPPPCDGGLCGDPCDSCGMNEACFESQCFARCAPATLACPCGNCVVMEGAGLEICASVIGGFCENSAACQQQHGSGWVCADNSQCLHAC